MDFLKMYFIAFLFLTVGCNGIQSSFPEDTMTDSNEELARFKRESFVQSILKHFPFFKHSFEPPEDTKTEKNGDDDEEEGLVFNNIFNEKPKNVGEEVRTVQMNTSKYDHILSIPLPTSSSLSLLPVQVSLLNNNITTVQRNSSITESANTTIIPSDTIASSPFEERTRTSFGQPWTTATPSLVHKALKSKDESSFIKVHDVSLGVIFKNSYTTIRPTSSLPFKSVTASNIFQLTTEKIRRDFTSSIYLPFPYPSSVPLEAISSKNENSKTKVFDKMPSASAVNFPLSSLMDKMTKAEKIQGNNDRPSDEALNIASTPSHSLSPEAPESTISLDEDVVNNRFRIPVLLGKGDDKNVRFLYINIIVPIISAIMGAMLITFGIMVFRCCRRRRLKKVRYFGGKPSSDLVRLDRMNLLSESSDDEYYD